MRTICIQWHCIRYNPQNGQIVRTVRESNLARSICLFIRHRFSAANATRDSFTDLLYPLTRHRRICPFSLAESNGNSIPHRRRTPTPPRNHFRNHRGARFGRRGSRCAESQPVRHRICSRSNGCHCLRGITLRNFRINIHKFIRSTERRARAMRGGKRGLVGKVAGSNRLRLRNSPWRHSAQLWQENSNFGLFQFKATCLPRRRLLVLHCRDICPSRPAKFLHVLNTLISFFTPLPQLSIQR